MTCKYCDDGKVSYTAPEDREPINKLIRIADKCINEHGAEF